MMKCHEILIRSAPKMRKKAEKIRNWCQISFVQFIVSIVSLRHTKLIEWEGGGRQLAGPNFGGLVLGYIEAKFGDQLLVVIAQNFPRSTRFTRL